MLTALLAIIVLAQLSQTVLLAGFLATTKKSWNGRYLTLPRKPRNPSTSAKSNGSVMTPSGIPRTDW